jgi:hypothetical protein
MKKLLFALVLSLFLMLFVAGCGSGSGGGSNSVAGSAKLAWDTPRNSDGTPVSNIAGYKVHYGTSSRNYDKTVNNGIETTCTISGLSPGTYYFAVTSYDSSGNESGFSNEASKTIQ